ncbi:MAG: sensor histidine kinase [Selenomonadaceae bacterium]|nr:sensor histidine kinase [Selenomonadaceae bacterium]
MGVHKLLWSYNGIIVLLLSGFMCVTQTKINQSMGARSFLEQVPVLPMPATESFLLTVFALGLMAALGWIYRHSDQIETHWRLVVFFAEVGSCVLLMRSINLAYDGVVLLVVADIMRRYGGRHLEYFLVAAMLGLYFVSNYNLAVFQMKVIPFEAYISYYDPAAQTVLLAARNVFVSVNIALFVIYMVLLVKGKHEEKERIRLLNEKLGEANERLRAYAIEAERMAETRERNRLAREIHDTLGHALTGIVAGLDACILTVEAAPDFTRVQLEKIRDTAQRGMTDVRRSVKKLRPADLEKLPFREALTRMTEEFAASSGMDIHFIVVGWPERLREDQEEVIYRVVQEGITNANRHGRAKTVNLTIGCSEGKLRIIIADDGMGCEDVKQGFGLRHMKERLELLHGSLNFWNDAGFIIEAEIPMNQEEAL